MLKSPKIEIPACASVMTETFEGKQLRPYSEESEKGQALWQTEIAIKRNFTLASGVAFMTECHRAWSRAL